MTRKKNKNQRNMLNDENACIRYLMKEMDPSEEVLMERAMMEDDDLLIEVESLRQTLKRLDQLPEKSPPAHLTNSIVEHASREAENRKQSPFISLQPVRYAAAAVLILGASLGGLWVYQDLGSPNSNEGQAALQANEARQTFNMLPVTDSSTEPWVDRKDVLYFNDQFQTASTEYDSILKNSLNKLTPLSNPFYYNTGSRSLQMTGTGIQK